MENFLNYNLRTHRNIICENDLLTTRICQRFTLVWCNRIFVNRESSVLNTLGIGYRTVPTEVKSVHKYFENGK